MRYAMLILVLTARRVDVLGRRLMAIYAGNLHEDQNSVFCAGVAGTQ